MKKRSSRTKPKTTRRSSAPAPTPESTAQVDVEGMVDERVASHDLRFVAEVAARLAPSGRDITLQDGMRIARNALNLLDGVREVVENRENLRSGMVKRLSEAAKVPDHLGWAAGKKYILGTDSGGSEERFYDFLKYRLRWERQEALRLQRINAGEPEPELEDVPRTTPAELNAVLKRFQKEGFGRSSLETFSRSYAGWRTTVDGRRKKK